MVAMSSKNDISSKSQKNHQARDADPEPLNQQEISIKAPVCSDVGIEQMVDKAVAAARDARVASIKPRGGVQETAAKETHQGYTQEVVTPHTSEKILHAGKTKGTIPSR